MKITKRTLRACVKKVASAILADVEPVRPARRKKAINLVIWGVSAQRTVCSGRQDAGLYGRRDARRYLFRPVLTFLSCLIGGFLLATPGMAQETNSPPTNSATAALTNTVSNTNMLEAVNTPESTNAPENMNDAGIGKLSDREESNHAQPMVLFGQNAELKTNETAEAVVVIGGSAKIHGHVRDAVVVIGGELEVDSEVGDAVVAIFGNVHVKPGAVIHQDAVAILGNVSVGQGVKIHGDSVAVLGTVSAASGATIGGDAVAIGGKLDLADGATVKGDKVNVGLPPPFANLEWLGKWFKYCALEFRPLAPQVGFVWIIAGVFFLIYLFTAAAFPRPVQVCVDDLNRRPATIFLMGLLTKLLVPFVYLILMATGIGLIVIPVIWVALFLFAIVGKVAILEWLGFKIGGLFGGRLQRPVLAFLIGTILITLLYMIPVVGLLTYLLLSVWGLGSGITAVFGRLRRETPEPPAPPSPSSAPAPTPGTINVPPFIPGDAPLPPGTAAHFESSAALGNVPPGAQQPQPAVSAAPVLPILSSFPKANLWERLCAAFLDIIFIGILSGLAHLGPVCLIVALAYFAGMWTWRGTTIGGIVLKLKVVRADGRPLTFVVALVRGLAAAFSVVVFFLGFLWIAWDKDKQGWHDKIAGTEVVRLPHSAPLVVL